MSPNAKQHRPDAAGGTLEVFVYQKSTPLSEINPKHHHFEPFFDQIRPFQPFWPVLTRVDRLDGSKNARLAWYSSNGALGTGEISPRTARFGGKKISENQLQGSEKKFKMVQ